MAQNELMANLGSRKNNRLQRAQAANGTGFPAAQSPPTRQRYSLPLMTRPAQRFMGVPTSAEEAQSDYDKATSGDPSNMIQTGLMLNPATAPLAAGIDQLPGGNMGDIYSNTLGLGGNDSKP